MRTSNDHYVLIDKKKLRGHIWFILNNMVNDISSSPLVGGGVLRVRFFPPFHLKIFFFLFFLYIYFFINFYFILLIIIFSSFFFFFFLFFSFFPLFSFFWWEVGHALFL